MFKNVYLAASYSDMLLIPPFQVVFMAAPVSMCVCMCHVCMYEQEWMVVDICACMYIRIGLCEASRMGCEAVHVCMCAMCVYICKRIR
jgi:hypothetical protein